MKLSIVIPVYNEEATLAQLLEQITKSLQRPDIEYEVIVADDGSVDGTWAVVERLSVQGPWERKLRGRRLSRNFGKESAIDAGLRGADGDA